MKYGKTESEIDVEETVKCRQIVKEIVNFGVTEDQKVKIIHFLSLELESRDDMIDIVNVVKMITERQVESSQSIIIE